MTKADLVNVIAEKAKLQHRQAEIVVNMVFDLMSEALNKDDRIEIRGFGSFSLHYRAPRIGRNPKTGDTVKLTGKYVPHFKPGKELRDRVNDSLRGDSI